MHFGSPSDPGVHEARQSRGATYFTFVIGQGKAKLGRYIKPYF